MESRYGWGMGLLLFGGVRLALLMALPGEALFAFGDYEYYFRLALWSVPGQCPAGPQPCLPWLDYWYEFPPLFAYLSLGLLRLTGGAAPQDFLNYAYALALVMLLADAGSFVLFYRLAVRLHGPRLAGWLSWVYALMPAPLILAWWTFDGLTTFWLLLALWALLARHDRRADVVAAVAIGLGVLTKFVPVLALASAWPVRSWRRTAAIALGAGALVVAVLAPFAARSPAFALASLQAQASKSSYATVWALLDGNWRTAEGQPITGNFGALVEHLDPARATIGLHNPPRVPGWLSTLAAGTALGALWLAARGRRPSAGQAGYFALQWLGLTFAAFVLWSKGWSPQWQQMLVPLLLLLQPDRQGVLLALALAGVSFLEWPVLLSRGLAAGIWLTAPVRTLLFIFWAWRLAGQLLPGRAPQAVEVPA